MSSTHVAPVETPRVHVEALPAEVGEAGGPRFPPSVALRPFLYEGRAFVAVIAKVTLDLSDPLGPTWRESARICVEDERRAANPLASLERTNDLAPRKTMCDVTLVGSARGAAPSLALRVRLSLHRDGARLLDKTVLASGGRDASSRQLAITSAPLIWEDALGGRGASAAVRAQNPVGTTTPRLLNATNSEGAGAYGPIPAHWAVRRALVTGAFEAQLDDALPQFTAGFPWEYFQHAPLDQRVPFLVGDERLSLEGVSEAPRLDVALPGTRVFSWWMASSSAAVPVPMVLDTLAIEGLRANLVFRGVAAPRSSIDRWGDAVFVVRFAGRAAHVEPPTTLAALAGAEPCAWATPKGRPLSNDATATLHQAPAFDPDVGAPFPLAAAGSVSSDWVGAPRALPWEVGEPLPVAGISADDTMSLAPPAPTGAPTYLIGQTSRAAPSRQGSRALEEEEEAGAETIEEPPSEPSPRSLAAAALRRAGIPEDRIERMLQSYESPEEEAEDREED